MKSTYENDIVSTVVKLNDGRTMRTDAHADGMVLIYVDDELLIHVDNTNLELEEMADTNPNTGLITAHLYPLTKDEPASFVLTNTKVVLYADDGSNFVREQ